MGNKCNCIANSQSTDEAEDALLGSQASQQHQQQQPNRSSLLLGRQATGQPPRGPPPPYQQVNPFYMLTEEQRLHIMTRLALIQSLPIGHYDCGGKEDKKLPLPEKEKDLCEKADNKSESRECPICMVDFNQGDPIRLLPCMHYYHTRCIDEWLMRAITCPNCMQRVDLTFHRSAVPNHRRGHRRNLSRGSGATGGITLTTNLPTPASSSPTHGTSSSEQLHNSSSATPTSPPPSSPSTSPRPLTVNVQFI